MPSPTKRRILLPLLLATCLGLALAAGRATTARAQIIPLSPAREAGGLPARLPLTSCGKKVFFLMYSTFTRPNNASVSPQPNGCWNWVEVHANGNYNVCSSVGIYPSIVMKDTVAGAPFVYDDTNLSHGTGENSVIQNTCMIDHGGSGTNLAVEYMASGGCGATNWQARMTGFTVGVRLRELYCADSARDQSPCSGISTAVGCVVNVGPDFGNVANLNNDISTVCGILDQGYAMGIYMSGYTDGVTQQGQINNALNNCMSG